MEEYYFLFAIGVLWAIVATYCDLKTTIIPNWISYSLVVFALGYRVFYSAEFSDWWFLLFGIIGMVLMFIFGLVFYYMGVFGGGDARLLGAFGAVLPYESFSGIFISAIIFVLVLFLFGAIWSLIYGVRIIYENRKRFGNEFIRTYSKRKWFVVVGSIGMIFSVMLIEPFSVGLIAGLFLFAFPFLWFYVKTMEKCMIVLTSPKDLIEGDWINKEIKIKGKWIKKSVHGLSEEEIKMITKANKMVWIKRGVPFTISFLFAIAFMALFYSVLKLWLSSFLVSLF